MMRSAKKETKLMTFNDYVDSLDDLDNNMDVGQFYELLTGQSYNTSLGDNIQDEKLKKLEDARYYYAEISSESWAQSEDFEASNEAFINALKEYATDCGVADMKFLVVDGKPCIPDNIRKDMPGACKSDEAIYFAPNLVDAEPAQTEPTEEKDTVSITDAFHEAIETCKDGDYGAALLQFGSAIVDKVKDVAGAAKDKVAGLIDPDFQDLIDEESKSGEQASVDDLQA